VEPASPTIGQLLTEATGRLRESGSQSARLDAELLLGHTLGMARAGLLAHPELAVPQAQADAFHDAVDRRAQGEPVAYLRGIKEFYGLAFSVDPRALIPRPETELLVELALGRLRERLTGRPRPPGSAPLQVWDIGTGSGAIAVSVAVESRRRGYASEVRILATDVSLDALQVATENAVGHGVADIVELSVVDLLEVEDRPPADLLLANLPYIPSSVVPTLPVAASFEPRLALDGGSDGLAMVRRLLAGLPGVMAADGQALLEIGSDQPDALAEGVQTELPGWQMELHHDLAGLPRVAELRRS
jgi:release factor glutamine methyltransferase